MRLQRELPPVPEAHAGRKPGFHCWRLRGQGGLQGLVTRDVKRLPAVCSGPTLAVFRHLAHEASAQGHGDRHKCDT